MSVTLVGVGAGIAVALAAEAVIGGVTYYFHPEYFAKCQALPTNPSFIVPQERRDVSSGGFSITDQEGSFSNVYINSIEPIVNL